MKKSADINIYDNSGRSIAVYMVEKGHIDNFKILLALDITIINTKFHGLPILGLAILRDNIEFVKLLLSNEADFIVQR